MSDAFLSVPAARLRASVVGIVDEARRSLRRRRGGFGEGAGIAWRRGGRDDLFVTSAHVVTGSKVTVLLPDGRAIPGEVVRRDGERDLAVVQARGAELPAITTSDPYALRPGSLAFAVGHPFGVRHAVSVGVLQAVGSLPRGYGLDGKGSLAWVQADLRLAPGSSGGPVADVDGNVIGVAAMIVSGLALAVPVPDVERLVSGL